MAKRNHTRMRSVAALVVGMDVGDKKCQLCLLRPDRSDPEHRSVSTSKPALRSFFSSLPPGARIVLETGTHSHWIADLLTQLGHIPRVLNARRLDLISKQDFKTDKSDAELLAFLGLDDTRLERLLRPVALKPEQARADLALLKSRDALVRSRTLLVNCARGLAKSLGERLPKCDARDFHKLLEHPGVPAPLRERLRPLLQSVAALSEQVRVLDKQIDDLVEERYPQTQRLTQVSGVGNLIALTFVLSVGDPKRFEKSRDVAAYFGMVPGRAKSGEDDPELRITKAGSPLVRKLMVQAAQSTLQARSPDSELKRFGQRLAGSSKKQKKRAVVAVARKLTVLLHRLWVSGEKYQPLGYGAKQAGKKQAA